jgi:hypothetical protein
MVTPSLRKRSDSARCAGLIRLGGLLPPLSAGVALAALRVFGGGRIELAAIVGVLVLVGQVMVWIGVLGLRKAREAEEDVGFQLAVGGVLTALTVYLTGVPELMLFPLAPPLAGILAQRRAHRRNRKVRG